MRIFKLFLFILLAAVIQSTILSGFTIFGIKPDLLLIITALFAVSYGPEEGILVGFLCGMMQDFFGGYFFIHIVSKSFLGFLTGTFKESVFGTEEVVSISAVFVATVTNFLLEAILLFFFFGSRLPSFGPMFIALVISCIYNSVLAPFIYPLVKQSFRFVEES